MAGILQSFTSSSSHIHSHFSPQNVTSLYTQPSVYTSWSYVRPRFKRFLENVQLTDTQIDDGLCKSQRIISCLNRVYWNSSSRTDHSLIVGSWGKGTQCRPPRDLDLMFILPPEVYYRFEQRLGDRQTQLLQEVKNILLETYPSTEMRADGQVVVIPFISYTIELLPLLWHIIGQSRAYASSLPLGIFLFIVFWLTASSCRIGMKQL